MYRRSFIGVLYRYEQTLCILVYTSYAHNLPARICIYETELKYTNPVMCTRAAVLQLSPQNPLKNTPSGGGGGGGRVSRANRIRKISYDA